MIRLKVERLKRGWSQQDLAVRAKMGVADVCRIERGWQKPFSGQAKRLARALGLRPNELLLEVDDDGERPADA